MKYSVLGKGPTMKSTHYNFPFAAPSRGLHNVYIHFLKHYIVLYFGPQTHHFFFGFSEIVTFSMHGVESTDIKKVN